MLLRYYSNQVGARADLRAFTLITTLLHDAPQLVAQCDGGGGVVGHVALGCSIASLCYTLASRANAVCFLFARYVALPHRSLKTPT